MTQRARDTMASVLEGDEVETILRRTFYGGDAPTTAPTRPKKARPKAPKPDHYEVICISMYKEDLGRLDEKVTELKEAGHRKMSRSALIRFALDQVDLSKLPKSY
jgi:hypothetical protein